MSELNSTRGGTYSPSEFMRARRPELFSDSKVRTENLLSRDLLDYHLGVLTSKKQEIDFEHFCRRIAEQELCPNLISQTGPTGGGDSKVDSETYPVSERISTRWYQGLPNNSGQERWAFAFSAKREWRSKVRADVENIASTNRRYNLIYFITNQYVKDKSRAQVEDQLSGRYGTRVRIHDRKDRLGATLLKLSHDSERPNNALSARTHLAFLDILSAPQQSARAVAAIKELMRIAAESEGLIDYPVEIFARIVDELGILFADVPQYDELVDALVDLTQRRAGQQQAGRMLLTRGLQKLRALRVYDAIRLFGRAQQKLAMREAREELTHALFTGGLAYEAAGLLWAARANVLASANLVHTELREGGPIPDNALLWARKLAWHELQLGRVAHVLEWIEYVEVLAAHKGLDRDQKEKFLSEREAQDLTLALLLLKTDVSELMELRFLPDALERLDLLFSRMALLYALGYEDLLRSEGSVPPDESSESLLSTFSDFIQQSAAADLPAGPTALGGGSLTFVSPVLGCRVVARTEPDYASQRLAERILVGIEALLATSLEEALFPYREELIIEISLDVAHQGEPKIVRNPSLGTSISVVHGTYISDHHSANRDWFLHFLSSVLTSLVMIPQPETYFRRIFGEESGLARSLNFTESAITMSNLLGQNPKTRISDWNTHHNPRAYVPKRSVAWHGGRFDCKAETVRSEPKFGLGEIPHELLNQEKAKHTERRVHSLIDLPLWDRAKWRGVLYIWPLEMDVEPWLAFGFEDGTAAKAIFTGWRDKLGSADKEDRIRISILTGVDLVNPSHYSVVVGSNLVGFESGQRVKQFLSWSRIHRMEPSSSKNLTAFVNRLERIGTYFLMPAHIDLKTGKHQPYPELAIQKRQIRICQAWEIGEHDPDGVGIFPNDKPIIPEGIPDPPVLRLLRSKRKRSEIQK